MLKLVNIYPNGPITTINPPIRTALTKFSMDVADIRKCLLANAYVEEILNGSKTIQLTFENYDKDNDPVIDAPKTAPKMVPVNHDVKVDDNIEPEEKTVTPEVNEDPKVEDGSVEDSTLAEDKTVEETTSEDESAEPVEEQVPIEDAVVEETTEEAPVEDGSVEDSAPVEDKTVEETTEDTLVDETAIDTEDAESVEKTTVVENDNNSYSKKNRKKNNYKRVN